ncbi:MAG: hypothetical protein Q9214_005949, partial [Letrouitia sp. 1 TL-2023]
RRTGHSQKAPDTRGRKVAFTEEEIDKCEALLDKYGQDAKTLPWSQLPGKAGVDLVGGKHQWRSISRRLKKHATTTRKRREYAKKMLEERPKPEHWEDVLFTDGCYFGFGPEGKGMIIRREGERYEPKHVQLRGRRPNKEEKPPRVHAWAAVGYNFISNLYFYEVPTNENGKIS